MKYKFFLGLFLLLIPKGYSQIATGHFDYEKSSPSAVMVGSGAIDSQTRYEKIVLDGFGSKIPFYHFINQRNSNNSYAILLHGLGGEKDYWIYPSMPYLEYTQNLTSIKDSLISLGFNLVIPDAKYHGERSYELNFRNPASLPPGFSKNKEDALIFYDLYVSTIREVRLIMDYLEESNQDSDLTFNLIGYSMGGAFSLILNHLDQRVHCVAACVPPLARPFSELENLDWPGEIAEKMKAISPFYVATDQEAPVAIFMGKTDFFIPMEEAESFFEMIPVEDKKLKYYDAGHELPADYMEDVIHWIMEHHEK